MSKVIAIGPYSDSDAAALKRDFDALRLPGLAAIADLSEDQRHEVRAVAFMGHDPFGGATMDLLPGLRAIANFGVGYDAIDVAAATARGIRVTNTPEVLNDDVADLAVAMWIAQARDFDFYVLSRYEDCSAAVRDFKTFSSAQGTTLESLKAQVQLLINTDPPVHSRMRHLIVKLL